MSETPNTCTQPDCDKRYYGRGKCKNHYMTDYRAAEKQFRYQQPTLSAVLLCAEVWEFAKKELGIVGPNTRIRKPI